MFDGTSKQKRNVSLRGKSKEENTMELSRRVEREREGRAKERLHTLRTLTLQRFARGRLASSRRRRAERADWDAKLHDLERLQAVVEAAGASFLAPAAVLLSLQSQFLFFYTYPEDLPRLGRLCSLLEAGFASANASTNPFSQLSAATDGGRLWLMRMSRLAVLCLHAIGSSAAASAAASAPAAAAGGAAANRFTDLSVLPASLAGALHALTDPAEWSAHGVAAQVAIRGCEELHLTISLANQRPGGSWCIRTRWGLARASLFSALVACLRSPHPPPSSHSGGGGAPLASVVCRAVLRVLAWAAAAPESSEQRSAIAFLLASEVLPTHGLLETPWIRQSLSDALVRDAATVFWPLAESAAADAQRQRLVAVLPPAAAACAVANLLRLEFVAPAGRRAAAFVHLLSALLRGLPLQALLSRPTAAAAAGGSGTADDPMDVAEDVWDDADDERLAVKLDVIVRREASRHATLVRAQTLSPAVADAAATTVKRLVDPTVVTRLFDAVLPPQTATSTSTAASSADDDAVLSLCQLYADFLVLNSTSSAAASAAAAAAGSSSAAAAVAPGRAVLNALAFSRPSAPVVLRLWEYLSNSVDLPRYASSASYAGARAGAGSALLLLCAVLSHQLLALDDEDLFEGQVPLKLAAVRTLTTFLRDWLCRLYWTDSALEKLTSSASSIGGSSGGGSGSGSGSALAGAQLMLAATRLFNQLYERNSRRSFFEDSQWYWPAISARELQPPDANTMDSAAIYGFYYGGGKLAQVLTNIPQVIPFQQRVAVFRSVMESEKEGYQAADMWNQQSIRIRVRREQLYEDSFDALNGVGTAFKSRVQVTLVNEHGVEEAGIDGGGLFKEFMDSLTKRAFDPQYGLWQATSEEQLYPNPASGLVSASHLEHFEFMGRVLGKALYEGILVEPQFSPVFLSKLLGRHTYFDDLYSLDPELYKGLVNVKALAAAGGDVSDLALTFSATTNVFGKVVSRPLLPGGDTEAPVTNGNVVRYIHAMANFKLNVETAQQCHAFLRGFRDLIPFEWMGLFGPRELQLLIGGDDERGVDLDNLRSNTTYAGGYHPSQPVIKWFWEALKSFSASEQGQFLKFVTSCSRQPLLGFEHLAPPVCIQKVPAGGDGGGERLPSSATCMNLLKLPEYRDSQTLRQKLLYAISANAGFELT